MLNKTLWKEHVGQAVRKLSVAAWSRIMYAVIILGIIGCYPFMRSIMIDQSSSYIAYRSNVTLNFLLFLFMAGYVTDRELRRRKVTGRKNWVIWCSVMIAVFALFRLVGMKTIFG